MSVDEKVAPPVRAGRLWAFAAVGLIGLLNLEIVWLLAVYFGHPGQPTIGADQQFYRDMGSRWLADGSYMWPEQLAGPYDMIPSRSILYPPTALLLFVPSALLPAILWWAVPIALLGYGLWTLRPAPWTWVVMLSLLAWPHAIGAYLVGNTDMWAVAFIALGIRFGWPAVLVAFKPLYLPFVLVGVRRRSFWVAGLALTAVSLLMLPLWSDYLTAMWNLRTDPTYWLLSLPLLAVPFVAWIGRTAN